MGRRAAWKYSTKAPRYIYQDLKIYRQSSPCFKVAKSSILCGAEVSYSEPRQPIARSSRDGCQSTETASERRPRGVTFRPRRSRRREKPSSQRTPPFWGGVGKKREEKQKDFMHKNEETTREEFGSFSPSLKSHRRLSSSRRVRQRNAAFARRGAAGRRRSSWPRRAPSAAPSRTTQRSSEARSPRAARAAPTARIAPPRRRCTRPPTTDATELIVSRSLRRPRRPNDDQRKRGSVSSSSIRISKDQFSSLCKSLESLLRATGFAFSNRAREPGVERARMYT